MSIRNMAKKILIFASGNGSNFQAIVEQLKDEDVLFELLVDKENCFARERAKNLGIKCHYVPFKETVDFLKTAGKYDLYVLAGYMRILPKEVLDFGTFINIHPSLLPKYKGVNAIGQAYSAGEKECGVSVHYVCEEVDSGDIIKQATLPILEGMSLEELETEVHKLEHLVYPEVIKNLLRN